MRTWGALWNVSPCSPESDLRISQRRTEKERDHGEPEMSILEVPYKDLFLATMENLNMKKHKCEWKNVKGEWDQWGR